MLLRSVIAGALILCCSGVATGRAPTVLVGQLTRQYVKQCGKDRKVTWVAPHFQIGFIRVVPARGLRLEPLLGHTVVASGRVSTKAPAQPSPTLENCPGRQMRNDWVEARGGTRVRGPHPGLLGSVKVLHATRARSLKLLRLEGQRGRVKVVLYNSLPVPLPGLMLHARYERCFGKKRILQGKPMAASETRKLGTLAPGKRLALNLPAVKSVLPKYKKTHALREVYLYSAAARSLVDLSQEQAPGLDPTCR